MNRDFTQEELDCIKNLFSEDEFDSLLYKIKTKLKRKKEILNKEKLIQNLNEIKGVYSVRLASNSAEDLGKTIVYDYKIRKDIKIFFELYDYGMRVVLKTGNYGYSAKSIEDLLDKLSIIHKGIDDGII